MFPLSTLWGIAYPILNLSGNKWHWPALLVEASNVMYILQASSDCFSWG